MKQRKITLTLAALFLSALTLTLAQGRRLATATLSETAKSALITALAGPDGEYAARGEYEAILDKFGAVLPYAHILQAEERHIAALVQLCQNFGVEVPEDEFLGKVQAPESLVAAAEAGILAEKANLKMYDELLPAVQAYPSLAQVFTQLRTASTERHLPALEAALANNGVCSPANCPTGDRQQQAGARCPGRGHGCMQRCGGGQPIAPNWRRQGRE